MDARRPIMEKDTTAPRVLAVDDEERALRLVSRVLGGGGVACVTAGSASEALALLRADAAIDVVLSDIYMPTTGGLEFLAQIRQEFRERPWLQLLLITGQASVETAVAAMRLDASDYLLKPVDPGALRDSVRHALARACSIREVHGATADSASGLELRRMADAARELALRIGRAPSVDQGTEPALGALELLQQLQSARTSLFGQAVMPEPAWEMLAELMRARLAGKNVSITSLALASSSPMTTSLRRIEDLIQGGLAARVPDPVDRRRTYVDLTPEGVTRMRMFLEGFSRMVFATHRGSA